MSLSVPFLEQSGARVADRFVETWNHLAVACLRLKAQMAERKQTIVGVLQIEDVVGPVSVKTAFVRPKRVDEIETWLFQIR